MHSCVHTCALMYAVNVHMFLILPMYMMHNRRELFISHYFKRHFWWYECVMFPSYIPKNVLSNTTVFISEQDGILNPGTAQYNYKTNFNIYIHIMLYHIV
jgi:hypothetical protein